MKAKKKTATARPIAVPPPAPVDPVDRRETAFRIAYLAGIRAGLPESDDHPSVCLGCGSLCNMSHQEHGHCQEVMEDGSVEVLLSRSELNELHALALSIDETVLLVFRRVFTTGLKTLSAAVAKAEAAAAGSSASANAGA